MHSQATCPGVDLLWIPLTPTSGATWYFWLVVACNSLYLSPVCYSSHTTAYLMYTQTESPVCLCCTDSAFKLGEMPCSVRTPFFHLIATSRLASPDQLPKLSPDSCTWLGATRLGSTWPLPQPRDWLLDPDHRLLTWPGMWPVTWYHVTYCAPDQSGARPVTVCWHVIRLTLFSLTDCIQYWWL